MNEKPPKNAEEMARRLWEIALQHRPGLRLPSTQLILEHLRRGGEVVFPTLEMDYGGIERRLLAIGASRIGSASIQDSSTEYIRRVCALIDSIPLTTEPAPLTRNQAKKKRQQARKKRKKTK